MLFADSCDVEHKGTISRDFSSSGLLRCWYSISSSVLTSLVPSDKKIVTASPPDKELLGTRWHWGPEIQVSFQGFIWCLGHPIIALPSPSSSSPLPPLLPPPPPASSECRQTESCSVDLITLLPHVLSAGIIGVYARLFMALFLSVLQFSLRIGEVDLGQIKVVRCGDAHP